MLVSVWWVVIAFVLGGSAGTLLVGMLVAGRSVDRYEDEPEVDQIVRRAQ